MSDINNLPDQFETFAQARKNGFLAAKEVKDSGKKMIGTFCCFTPSEIIIAAKAIPECSIVFMEGDEMQTILSGYLNTLNEQNPEIIGGQLPDEDF